MSSAEEWDFFQDESGRWRWLHIDAAGKRSVSPSGFDTEEAAKKHAEEEAGYAEQEKKEQVAGSSSPEKTTGEQWYFFRADDSKWRWLKVNADGKRQIAKEGFASEEIARGAASQNGFTGEGKVIRQPVSLQNLKTKSSSTTKKAAVGAKKDDEWQFFEDGEGKWRWLRISPTGKRHVSPVGFVSVKLARANAKNFGYHGIRFNREQN
ncbi:hypothetical protein [Piscirickettsia litoralis]|uniref:DUF1508 domain-containing protein n=1 Tax=Piscirickettsia litoralis TaxID=1891921 RepID=A0ABX3A1N5_9GAMM|nr:hypothetical protein [Piscirickettsia litoralis]ODN42733.1 hypothetical protein BGC07_07100 [Piscirickettsia litoralis]